MAALAELFGVTKIYRTQERVFLPGLGDLFDKAKEQIHFKDLLSPGKLQQTFKDLKGIGTKKLEALQKSNFSERAKLLKELLLKED